MTEIVVIDMNALLRPWSECVVCGIEEPNTQSVAVSDNGYVVSDDYEGEWAGMPACRACYSKQLRGELTGFDLWAKP